MLLVAEAKVQVTDVRISILIGSHIYLKDDALAGGEATGGRVGCARRWLHLPA